MSRIGKRPIPLPPGVTITVAGRTVRVNGPKGTLAFELRPEIAVRQEENTLVITVQDPSDKAHRALWGLSRALIKNMVEGVAKGFEKRLEIQGVGFRAQEQGAQALVLSLGFSHPLTFPVPNGVTVRVEKSTIIIQGIDKQQVGEVAAKIRALKPPEPYKGKGIRYADEIVRRKVGKVVKAAGTAT